MMSRLMAHLRLALRACAVSLLIASFIWGADKLISSSPKQTPIPEMSSTVIVDGLDFDTGHAYLNSAYFAGFLPAKPASIGLHCAELVSYETSRDLYAHVRRVNEFSRQIYFLARYSDISSESDERLVEISKRAELLDLERREILKRLFSEISASPVASFLGYYEMVVDSTLLTAWKTLAYNDVGLARAIEARSGFAGKSEIPDLSSPEWDATLLKYVFSL